MRLMDWFSKLFYIVNTIFPVLFKVAIQTNISKIQKGAVGEPDQLAKDKLQVRTLTDNWCKLESLNYFTIIMLN